MNREELLVPFDRLLSDVCPPSVARAVDAGDPIDRLWSEIEASGYLDALVPEPAGGAGLSMGDAAPLFMALGRHAAPAPVAETMVARALLARAGIDRPAGPILLLDRQQALPVPFARTASHALVEADDNIHLVSLNQAQLTATGEPGTTAAFINWPAPEGRALGTDLPRLRPLSAVLLAAAIAGAADRLLDMTVAFADERVQFGKPIGRQQAVQQQLAVMAEKVVATRMAAEIGCAAGLDGGLGPASVAKQVASAAAVIIADTAHAVHGAIGISEEHDLQLFSRRLRSWRLASGSETYWAERLGQMRLASDISTIDFIRKNLNLAEPAR
jgi:alkylation response protein AidB-like acyl-CoA dehydrogenase